MSSPRILGEPSRETNYYHTMSRIIERRFVFKNPVAAAKLRQIIFNQAKYSDHVNILLTGAGAFAMIR